MPANMTFNINTELAYQAGDNVQLSHDADNYVIGTVVSYNKGTGLITITPTAWKGSGTYSSWTVNLTGTPGSSGTSASGGSSGKAGESGSSGKDGAPGQSGSSGKGGKSNTSGQSGDAGSAGTTGTSGTRGESGSSGKAGAHGSSGNSRTSGAAGGKGSNGNSGSAGNSGGSGSNGTSGSAGASGGSGKAGANGPSGGSGVNGPTGPTGGQGPTGPTGAQGAGGTSGVNGATGPTGAQGAQGPRGPQGSTGPQGPTGAQGATGPAGAQGPTGPAGGQGPQTVYNQSLNQGDAVQFSNVVCQNEAYSGGGWRIQNQAACSANQGAYWYSNGNWVSAGVVGSSNYFGTSSSIYKTDIKPYQACAIDLINTVDIVEYELENPMYNHVKLGFIADDTAEEFAGPNHDKMDITNSIGVALKALQELNKKIDNL